MNVARVENRRQAVVNNGHLLIKTWVHTLKLKINNPRAHALSLSTFLLAVTSFTMYVVNDYELTNLTIVVFACAFVNAVLAQIEFARSRIKGDSRF